VQGRPYRLVGALGFCTPKVMSSILQVIFPLAFLECMATAGILQKRSDKCRARLSVFSQAIIAHSSGPVEALGGLARPLFLPRPRLTLMLATSPTTIPFDSVKAGARGERRRKLLARCAGRQASVLLCGLAIAYSPLMADRDQTLAQLSSHKESLGCNEEVQQASSRTVRGTWSVYIDRGKNSNFVRTISQHVRSPERP
jgi:hypothetical protein